MIVHYTKIRYEINQSFQQDWNAHMLSQLHAFACLMSTSLAFFTFYRLLTHCIALYSFRIRERHTMLPLTSQDIF